MTKRRMPGVVGLTATAFLMGVAATLSAQEGEPVVLARAYTIASEVLAEDRPVQVALPADYDSTRAYPVVYVLDGPAHLVHTVGTVRFLAANDRMPEAIVVAVGNTAGNRTRDLTPPLREPDPNFQTAGGASDFRAFLRDELKPWVEAHHRTRPYDVLIGHSFGGLFVAHVLNTEPELFDAYIAISPSLWWDDEHVVGRVEAAFERFPGLRGALYMTMGNEGGRMLAGAWSLASTLEKHAPTTFRWHWEPMPEETHGSVPARSTYDGLEWIFSGWYPQELLAELARRGPSVMPRIETHFRELSEELGWQIRPPQVEIVNTAFRLADRNRAEDALGIALEAAEWFPDSAYARLGVGVAYRGACRWPEAIEHHERALEMAEAAGSRDLADGIRSELAAVRQRMEDGETCDGSG